MSMIASGQYLALTPELTLFEGALAPRYVLSLDGGEVCLNDVLGCRVTLTNLRRCACVACGKVVRKLYSGGHCYDCSTTLARCDLCVMSPHRCHFHQGTCREPDWAAGFCMQPHTVYISNTSGPKVGITRRGREHRRWVDQGASSALAIAHTPTRRSAGLIEHALSHWISDRTDWRKLVTGTGQQADLLELAQQLIRNLPHLDKLSQSIGAQEELVECHWLSQLEPLTIGYPLHSYAPAHRHIFAGEDQQICDNLQGVVGRYLLLEQGVLNLADYAGEELHLELDTDPVTSPEADQMSLF